MVSSPRQALILLVSLSSRCGRQQDFSSQPTAPPSKPSPPPSREFLFSHTLSSLLSHFLIWLGLPFLHLTFLKNGCDPSIPSLFPSMEHLSFPYFFPRTLVGEVPSHVSGRTYPSPLQHLSLLFPPMSGLLSLRQPASSSTLTFISEPLFPLSGNGPPIRSILLSTTTFFPFPKTPNAYRFLEARLVLARHSQNRFFSAGSSYFLPFSPQ